jgi:hypothetical protein
VLGYFVYIILPSVVLVAPPTFFAILVISVLVRAFVPRLRLRTESWVVLGGLITAVVIYFWGRLIVGWADENEYIDFF